VRCGKQLLRLPIKAGYLHEIAAAKVTCVKIASARALFKFHLVACLCGLTAECWQILKQFQTDTMTLLTLKGGTVGSLKIIRFLDDDFVGTILRKFLKQLQLPFKTLKAESLLL
jgi:hypothetical protein